MLGLVREYLPTLGFIVISFACGYAVRDWISKRRHAAEREFLQKTSRGSPQLSTTPCFVVKDADGQKVAYVYLEPGRQAAATYCEGDGYFLNGSFK
jgi:hypothetical protein